MFQLPYIRAGKLSYLQPKMHVGIKLKYYYYNFTCGRCFCACSTLYQKNNNTMLTHTPRYMLTAFCFPYIFL